MMYRHTITVYDRRFRLVKTIPDAVRPREARGIRSTRASVRGAPVEAAFSPDGTLRLRLELLDVRPGFGPEGHDVCSPSSGYDRSFVYRVDVAKLRIDRAIAVGSVPKFVAVTPDGRFVARQQLVLVRPQRRQHRTGRRCVKRLRLGPVPARHRRRPDAQLGLRRGHGLDARSRGSTSTDVRASAGSAGRRRQARGTS